MSRPRTKTAILSLRVIPAVKDALQRAATAERRSLANMVEILVLEGCARRGVAGDEEPLGTFTANRNPYLSP